MTELYNQYTYRVIWSDEDGENVGLCAEFPSLSWLAESPESALAGIREVVQSSLGDMRSNGEELPEPLSIKEYSGKFMVRIPPQTHRRLAMQAAEAGVSLNRIASSKLEQ